MKAFSLFPCIPGLQRTSCSLILNTGSLVQLLSAAYCVVSILSFEHVLSVYTSDNDNVDDHELWAFLGATLIAPVMVIGFYFFGTFVMVKKTVTEGGMSYSYGALHISTLWMSMLVLLASVSIHAYKDRMKRWEKVGVEGTIQCH